MLYYNNRAAARNPYWLSAGIEVGGVVLWSQPEVAIYDRDVHGGTSGGGYPDFVQACGAPPSRAIERARLAERACMLAGPAPT